VELTVKICVGGGGGGSVTVIGMSDESTVAFTASVALAKIT
jgi:hypothetical protein